ncbi:unnamed protein product [Hymenolepis diminuta]|uniref:Uncharacterized protein n=1 Tax=Hymenolepis diminuta TaxID=6216 RepID=A0A158QGD9_HYMDI|nr:unnamed protein product [Hymenolepis diminuta]
MELTKRATKGGQGGPVTAGFHVQRLHHVRALSTANYVVSPLEIKTARGLPPCSQLIEEKRCLAEARKTGKIQLIASPSLPSPSTEAEGQSSEYAGSRISLFSFYTLCVILFFVLRSQERLAIFEYIEKAAQHLHLVNFFSKANNLNSPLEINCKRKTMVIFIHWSEGEPLPLFASSTSSFTRPLRQQLCGAEWQSVPSNSTDDQDARIY